MSFLENLCVDRCIIQNPEHKLKSSMFNTIDLYPSDFIPQYEIEVETLENKDSLNKGPVPANNSSLSDNWTPTGENNENNIYQQYSSYNDYSYANIYEYDNILHQDSFQYNHNVCYDDENQFYNNTPIYYAQLQYDQFQQFEQEQFEQEQFEQQQLQEIIIQQSLQDNNQQFQEEKQSGYFNTENCQNENFYEETQDFIKTPMEQYNQQVFSDEYYAQFQEQSINEQEGQFEIDQMLNSDAMQSLLREYSDANLNILSVNQKEQQKLVEIINQLLNGKEPTLQQQSSLSYMQRSLLSCLIERKFNQQISSIDDQKKEIKENGLGEDEEVLTKKRKYTKRNNKINKTVPRTCKNLKRVEENQKIVFKKAFNYIESQFLKENLPEPDALTPQQKTDIFHAFYFKQTSEQYGIPLDSFYHPEQKTTRNKQYKSFNQKYIDIILLSNQFSYGVYLYLKDQFITNCLFQRNTKVKKMLKRCQKFVNDIIYQQFQALIYQINQQQTPPCSPQISQTQFSQFITNLQLSLYKHLRENLINNPKTKLPWSTQQLQHAHSQAFQILAKYIKF